MKCCETCGWYAAFEGVCCNSESEYRGGWPPEPETYFCAGWKEAKEDG